MTPATTRKTTRARRSRPFEIVNVWIGGGEEPVEQHEAEDRRDRGGQRAAGRGHRDDEQQVTEQGVLQADVLA